jgi:predicted RNA polymerase sigma factor
MNPKTQRLVRVRPTRLREAAAAYEHVEEAESSERCALHVKALPIYWDETHHDAKWG